MLKVLPSSAGEITAPAGGSVLLAGKTATFTWTRGANISQYQLLLGTTVGGAEFYTGTPTAGQTVSVAVPSVVTRSLYVTLKSLTTTGVWQSRTYAYETALAAVTPMNNGKGDRRYSSTGSGTFDVVNNGQPVRTGPYFFELCPRDGGACLAGNARAITSCTVSDEGVTSRMAIPSEYEPTDNSAYDLIVTATQAVRPGRLNITCNYEGRSYSGTWIDVYDASPEIDAIIQYAPEASGGPFYVSLFGRNFGSTQGTVSVCNAGTFPCNEHRISL